MKKYIKTLTTIAVLISAVNAHAAGCRQVQWKAGDIVKVNSALYLGTRIQLPEGTSLVTKDPFSSNSLWNAAGAANQVTIQPTSGEAEGAKSMITIFLSNGEALDIEANRVSQAANQQCVVINRSGMSSSDRRALSSYGNNQNSSQDVARLQQQMNAMQTSHELENKKVVSEALQRYRYFIYTRYNWSTGSGFSGKNIISDVYDDGRFTFIRISKPSRGLLAVTAEVGGEPAIVPTKYDDAYHIYQMSGIYPKFTLTLDGKKIEVVRADNGTNGEG
ncbi:TrbG/VirB9 family P-type conjugative transfer protein [Morganella morganii]|nr:TrbG/VirB9 family P-type conjugative transfer protein [Morganella morganii]